MLTGIEELALKDVVKHPKLVILYVVLLVLGGVASRFFPSEADKNADRWQSAFYHEQRRSDSLFQLHLQDSRYKELSIQQETALNKIDSMLHPLGTKAKMKLNNSKNGN